MADRPTERLWGKKVMEAKMPLRTTLFLFATVISAWGVNWTVTKFLVANITPLWTSAIRTSIAAIALLGLLVCLGKLVIPKRGDLPVVAAIGICHMVAFTALMTAGLKYVPAGRAIVLGYTTPLWVAPGAFFFLKEAMPKMRIVGVLIGLVGLAVMFNPLTFDWSDYRAIYGNGLLLLSALAWSVSILYVRAHKWISTPFQLVFWETLLATAVLLILAFWFEGWPQIVWTKQIALGFGYSGLVSTALAFWAMAMVNRSVPATVTSLGILATPVVGIVSSAFFLSERIDLPLIFATTIILVGVTLGTVPWSSWMRSSVVPNQLG